MAMTIEERDLGFGKKEKITYEDGKPRTIEIIKDTQEKLEYWWSTLTDNEKFDVLARRAGIIR